MRQQRQKNSQPDAASSSTAFQAAFLKQGTLQPGTTAGGLVFFKKPKGAKLKIQPQDVLYQIDIPVNGTVFRFK